MRSEHTGQRKTIIFTFTLKALTLNSNEYQCIVIASKAASYLSLRSFSMNADMLRYYEGFCCFGKWKQKNVMPVQKQFIFEYTASLTWSNVLASTSKNKLI